MTHERNQSQDRQDSLMTVVTNLRGDNSEQYAQITEQASKITKLQAVVDKLPKTKDGVPIVPGMQIYFVHNRTLLSFGRSRVEASINERTVPIIASGIDYYSTCKAAEASKGGK